MACNRSNYVLASLGYPSLLLTQSAVRFKIKILSDLKLRDAASWSKTARGCLNSITASAYKETMR